LGETYLERLKGARDLQAAIDACDPALAAIIMDRALDGLRIGDPGSALFSAMDQAITGQTGQPLPRTRLTVWRISTP
jgi:hypothetical protein